MTRRLQEYVTLVLPRSEVERALSWLCAMGATRGPAAWLHRELEGSLDRERTRESVARISTVLGEMDVGELFDLVSTVLEAEAAGELGDGDRRMAIASAMERAASLRGS